MHVRCLTGRPSLMSSEHPASPLTSLHCQQHTLVSLLFHGLICVRVQQFRLPSLQSQWLGLYISVWVHTCCMLAGRGSSTCSNKLVQAQLSFRAHTAHTATPVWAQLLRGNGMCRVQQFHRFRLPALQFQCCGPMCVTCWLSACSNNRVRAQVQGNGTVRAGARQALSHAAASLPQPFRAQHTSYHAFGLAARQYILPTSNLNSLWCGHIDSLWCGVTSLAPSFLVVSSSVFAATTFTICTTQTRQGFRVWFSVSLKSSPELPSLGDTCTVPPGLSAAVSCYRSVSCLPVT